MAGPPRGAAPAGLRRAAFVVAATCGLAAIARAQVADSGDSAAPAAAGGGGTGGTGTGGTGTGGTGGGGTGGGAPASDAVPGSLRAQIEGLLPGGANQPTGGPTTAPAWTVIPSIGLQEQWTDNAFDSASDRRASLITQLTPSLSINGASSRLTATLFYAPNLTLYSPQGSQNQIGQNLGADTLLTVSPEEFYIRTTGFAAVQTVSGLNAPQGTVVTNQANELQTYNFSIEPYVTHRFGGWGSLQVGAMASQTAAGPLGGGPATESLATRQEFATFASGENFGRLSSKVQLSATQETGTGALQGATDNTASYQAGYAITHSIIALASLGWEDIRYTGAGAPHYSDATWSIGTQLLPNPDSSITLSYGHQQGATAAAVNATYAPTATVRLFAQYSAGVTTAAQALNNALSAASFDATGLPINAVTGETVTANSNFFGLNSTVYQQRSLTLGVSWLLPRDAFQLTVSKQSQTPVGSNATNAVVLAAQGNLALTEGLAASSGTTGSLSWQHDLSAVLASNAFFQYGVLNNATQVALTNGVVTAIGKQIQNATIVTFGAGLTWHMTPTLNASLRYSYTSNDYGAGNPGVSANLVVLGLQKTF
jgi:uncharacterized protein (PEP-CTERM system associated)